jgi:hypothetical protein
VQTTIFLLPSRVLQDSASKEGESMGTTSNLMTNYTVTACWPTASGSSKQHLQAQWHHLVPVKVVPDHTQPACAQQVPVHELLAGLHVAAQPHTHKGQVLAHGEEVTAL